MNYNNRYINKEKYNQKKKYITKLYRMEAERYLMENGGKLINAVHVTLLKDGTASIKFEYLHHKSHVFQHPNI